MSQNNNGSNETTGIIMVFAFIGAALYAFVIMIGLLIIAIFLFWTLLLTILSLCAWKRTRSFGKLTITPEMARGFVYRGLAGAVGLPVLTFIASIFVDFYVADRAIPWIMLTGYGLASLGWEIFVSECLGGSEEAAPPSMPSIPPQAHSFGPLQITPPSNRPAPPFRYASWDDEDGQ